MIPTDSANSTLNESSNYLIGALYVNTYIVDSQYPVMSFLCYNFYLNNQQLSLELDANTYTYM